MTDEPRIVYANGKFFIRGVRHNQKHGYKDKKSAEARLHQLIAHEAREAERKMRKCLGGCDKMFLSEGPGNRICPNCLNLEKFRGML